VLSIGGALSAYRTSRRKITGRNPSYAQYCADHNQDNRSPDEDDNDTVPIEKDAGSCARDGRGRGSKRCIVKVHEP
jgi:hypothetical protein